MKQYSRLGPKVLGLLATLVASVHAPSALAEAVAKPSPARVGQVCASDAARLASAVFSSPASAAFGAGAGCVRPGSSAALAQAHFAVSPQSAPFSAALISAQPPASADIDAIVPPLAAAIGVAPADHVAPARPSSSASNEAALDAYRSQGPISTYGQDDAPVGLKLGFAF